MSSPGLTGRSTIPETAVIEPKGRGVLDAPVKPGHDSGVCRHSFSFSRRNSPELCQPIPPQRAQGMPDAGRTRRALRARKLHTHARKQQQGSRNNRHSPRNGFTAYTWSPRCTGLDGHRRLRIITANLIPASGDRDNTISPSARHHSSADAAASIASRAQRFVTTAKRPFLRGRDARTIGTFSISDKANYFSRRVLTRFRKISPSGKSPCRKCSP
jgi:hypothetical protein